MPEPRIDPQLTDTPARLGTADLRPRRSQWDGGGDRSHVKTFVLAAGLMALIGAGFVAAQPGVAAMVKRRFGPSPTAAELRVQVRECERAADLACAQQAWTDYLRLRPDDGVGLANLGTVMNRRDDHEHAVVQFKTAIDGGEGTYDLFGWYADSLARLGRKDEAIDWSYKALSIVPRLVDVRGKLAKLLVAQHRPYEALSLLESFDSDSVASGRQVYFEGQRIAIESGLAPGGAGPEAKALRLAAYGSHFHAPVTLGAGRPADFIVDTGATVTTVTP